MPTTTRFITRAPMFDSIADLLDWAERQPAIAAPVVYGGPEGSVRGSVEVRAGEDEQEPVEVMP